jgi:copper homeostasis protein
MIREACVETFEEALTAENRGADRIELCCDLANDGLTPSPELMQKTCSTLKIPVMVMIRPRAGDFIYTPTEISSMKREIELAKQAGAEGIVLGLLTPEGKIDMENTRLLAEYAHPLTVTFHKAIDDLADPVEGVIALMKIKAIKRILTSGGKATAKDGAETIRKMIQTAGGNLIIIAAGRITDKNIAEIQQLTEAVEFHGRKIAGDLHSII